MFGPLLKNRDLLLEATSSFNGIGDYYRKTLESRTAVRETEHMVHTARALQTPRSTAFITTPDHQVYSLHSF